MVNMADEVIEAKPDGADFSVPLGNHTIWFRSLSGAQRRAMLRAYARAAEQAASIRDSDLPDAEKLDGLRQLGIKQDKRVWDALGSLLIHADDLDLIEDAMITGLIEDDFAHLVFRDGQEVAQPDDAEPVVQPVKPKANAKRTRVR